MNDENCLPGGVHNYSFWGPAGAAPLPVPEVGWGTPPESVVGAEVPHGVGGGVEAASGDYGAGLER